MPPFILNFLYCLVCCVQLRQSQLELQEVQVSHRQLSSRLEELTEEHSLQSLTPHPSSLLCEIEQSMEQEEQEQEREQVTTRLVLLEKTTVRTFAMRMLPSASSHSCAFSSGRPTATCAHSAHTCGVTMSPTQHCPPTLPWMNPQRLPQPRMCLPEAFTPAC